MRYPNLKHRNSMLSVTLSVILLGVSACSTSIESNAEPQSSEDQTFTIVEQMPSPDGGMKSFYEHIKNEVRYPLDARKAGSEEEVRVQFVVERDGSISTVKAVSGSDELLKQEAVSVVQQFADFRPGNQRGRAVRVQLSVPIIFKLSTDKMDSAGVPEGIVIVEETDVVNQSLQINADYKDGTWQGKVTDPNGQPVPGTNIVVKGTSRGTVTNLEGTFQLEAEESQAIVVSFVGYETQILEN